MASRHNYSVIICPPYNSLIDGPPFRAALDLLLRPPPEGAGLDVSAGSHRALRSAAADGDAQTVGYLVDVWGADVRARGDEALRMAAMRGDAAVVEALLLR